MSLKIIFLISAVITVVCCKSVLVGQTYNENNQLIKFVEETVSTNAIPFFKRVTEKVYEVPQVYGNEKIKGIVITDLDNGLAQPSITLGGLGFKFVNIKLKSERGSGFNFLIEIYV
ncbi:hypothetical protein RR46_01634 [Papilio xuthus]|uniref:Salivary secreted peptide n=1 Tax=Papilio xuthus TaxID=66420 RepID=A0A0N1I541_PAPXU|nr:hypothetical protein RR46_01634 [Papilio xuthus]